MPGGAVEKPYGYGLLAKVFEEKGLAGYRLKERWCGHKDCVLLVAVEGPEGAGVTLTVQLFARMFRWLVRDPEDVMVLKFPSNETTGHVARTVGRLPGLRSQLLGLVKAILYQADFLYNFFLNLEYLRKPPTVVVFDRYKYSWLGFQLLDLEPWLAGRLYELLPPAHILAIVDRGVGEGGEVMVDKGDARFFMTAPLEFERMRRIFWRVEEYLEKEVLVDCHGEGCVDSPWRRFRLFKKLVYPWRPPKVFRIETKYCTVPSDACLESLVGEFWKIVKFLELKGIVEKRQQS